MHPNGQLPAYEWAFGDVNPPVHAWAAWRVYQMERAMTGRSDRAFLERVFHKLMLNFTWWVNRKDAAGRNIFQGGFLGLDNIGVFDRSAPCRPGATSTNPTEQAGWRCIASISCGWPWNWRSTTMSMRTSRRSSSSTFSASQKR